MEDSTNVVFSNVEKTFGYRKQSYHIRYNEILYNLLNVDNKLPLIL